MAEIVTPVRTDASFVDWAAIIAGALVAAALSFVLLTAGAAAGLTLLSPYPGASYTKTAAVLSVFWAIFVPILSFLAGGYLTGRLRAAWTGTDLTERRFRDGLHGLLMWALAIVAGGVMGFLAAGTAARLGADTARAALSNRSAIVAPAVDTLLRSAEPQAAAAAGSPAAVPAARPPMRTMMTANHETRDEIGRILLASASDGQFSPADRAYLAQTVADRTGLPLTEAETRVDQALATTVSALEKARKALSAAGLATATALLLGLVAAWLAAQNGGRHRDENMPARLFIWQWRKV